MKKIYRLNQFTNKIKKKRECGFTLLELLVVIAIIALMVGVALPNFVSSRARARDSKKIQEMQQLKTALRLYYNDYGQYPAAATGAIKYLANLQGCGTGGTTSCPVCTTADFAAGGSDGCQTVYMKKFPSYAAPYNVYYYQVNGGTDFRAIVGLENASDPSLATSQKLCPSAGGGSCTGTNYCVCGD